MILCYIVVYIKMNFPQIVAAIQCLSEEEEIQRRRRKERSQFLARQRRVLYEEFIRNNEFFSNQITSMFITRGKSIWMKARSGVGWENIVCKALMIF